MEDCDVKEKVQLLRELEDKMTKVLLDNRFHFCWKPTLHIPECQPGIMTLHNYKSTKLFIKPNYQIVNHFPDVKPLTTKSGLLEYNIEIEIEI